MPNTVVIYRSQYTAGPSTQDLNTFFTIHGYQPRFDDFTDPARLSQELRDPCPLLVLPGGGATVMGRELQRLFPGVLQQFNNSCHVLGVCAGAYVAADEMEIHCTSYESRSECDTAVEPVTTPLGKVSFSLGLLPGVSASGNYCPNTSILSDYAAQQLPGQNEHGFTLERFDYHPYAVGLQTDTNALITSLYVGGCQFEINGDHAATIRVHATYADQPPAHYSPHFFSNARFIQPNTPAIVSGPASYNSGMNVLLSGPHLFEAALIGDDSKMLGYFSHSQQQQRSLGLSENSLTTIKDSSEAAATFASTLIEDTFGKPKPRGHS